MADETHCSAVFCGRYWWLGGTGRPCLRAHEHDGQHDHRPAPATFRIGPDTTVREILAAQSTAPDGMWIFGPEHGDDIPQNVTIVVAGGEWDRAELRRLFERGSK